MLTPGQKRRRQRHEFLLTFFSTEPKGEEREVNGYWLVKFFNGTSNEWEVSIYTQDSYKKFQWIKSQVPARELTDSEQTNILESVKPS